MKCWFQLVHAPDGRRGECASCSREDFAGLLREHQEKLDGSLVLVLAHEVDGKFVVSQAPMMTVARFISEFGSIEHV